MFVILTVKSYASISNCSVAVISRRTKLLINNRKTQRITMHRESRYTIIRLKSSRLMVFPPDKAMSFPLHR